MFSFFDRVKNSLYKNWSNYYITLSVIFLITLAFFYSNPAPATITNTPDTIEERSPATNTPNDHDQRQLRCLAENAYFEARNQSRPGMVAVSHVVMNRVNDKRFPKTPCGVIYQRSGRSCQFSWVCFGSRRISDRRMFQLARNAAEDVYYGRAGDITRGARFFHALHVRPGWRLKRSVVIGDHIFYKG